MKTFSKSFLLILYLSAGIAACSTKRNMINNYRRALSEVELAKVIAEKDAELIFKAHNDQQTFIVLDAGSKILYGTSNTLVVEYDNQESSEHIGYYLSDVAINPTAKVGIYQEKLSRQTKDSLKETVSFSKGLVVVVIRDQAIQNKLEAFRFTFKDGERLTVPATSHKGILFQYDPNKDCCSMIELLSKNKKTLYRK